VESTSLAYVRPWILSPVTQNTYIHTYREREEREREKKRRRGKRRREEGEEIAQDQKALYGNSVK
jgi:hypothetical protein